METRYISLEAAIETLEEADDLSASDYQRICSAINSIPPADVVPAPRWIPVTERLPENGKYVLAYSADDDFMTVEARYKFEAFQITHWMPLPQSPKEGGGTR